MIDIHSHVIFGVDDGSPDLDTSIKMLKTMENEGITDAILTPHLDFPNHKTPKEIKDNFDILQKKAKEEKIKINLYLGQEINNKDGVRDLIKVKSALTMNNSKYILIEFTSQEKTDMVEVAYELIIDGYIPILAHVERYEYMTEEDLDEIKSLGGLIQVNASSVLGTKSATYKKRARRYIKKGYVDFVSSDYHSGRSLEMKKAYRCVRLRYGFEKAEKLFRLNAEKIIKG